jgi:hypothetical protein
MHANTNSGRGRRWITSLRGALFGVVFLMSKGTSHTSSWRVFVDLGIRWLQMLGFLV